jgi:DNA-directed RNA polymerase specialized sigma24 family protein
VRIYRRDDLDDEATPEPEPRIDRLRDLVDGLPELERHCVERLYFGQGTKVSIAREAGVSTKAVRDALARGLDALRAAVLEDHELGAVLPARFDQFLPVPQPRAVVEEG